MAYNFVAGGQVEVARRRRLFKRSTLFWRKTAILRFHSVPFGGWGLRGNVCCSSLAHWKLADFLLMIT